MKTESKFLFFDKAINPLSLKHIIKKIIYHPLNIFYKALVNGFIPKDTRECKYSVSVCAIFKNEAKFFIEWIEYHQMLGVQHFYLYNNNSTDNYLEVLTPYIDSGLVTLIEWPEIPGQLSSYQHWYRTYRNETNWVTFIDIDEFVCPKYTRCIQEWLKEYAKYPAVVMYWKFFCSSGRIEHDPKLPVIEQYTTCAEKPYNIGKVICNTRFDIDPFVMGMWHFTKCKYKGIQIPAVNVQHNFIIHDVHVLRNAKLNLFLNHYWSKSYYTLLEKKGKGASAFKETYITDEWFWRNDASCTKSDHVIFRFLLPLKLRLSQKNEK